MLAIRPVGQPRPSIFADELLVRAGGAERAPAQNQFAPRVCKVDGLRRQAGNSRGEQEGDQASRHWCLALCV